MKRELRWLLFFSILTTKVLAQDTLVLTLQNALNATLANNTELLLATLDQEKAIAKFRQTNSLFLPQVNVSYTAIVSNNPLNAFGFKLQQQSITSSDFNPQLLNNPSATQNYTAKAEFNQPLLNVEMLYQRKAAAQEVDVYAYKTKRIKEYLVFEVHKAYAQLQLAHQAVLVLIEAQHTINSLAEATKNRFEKGFLQKSDLLLVQVQVATIENKLTEAKSNVRNSSDYLSLLMNSKSRPFYTTGQLQKTDRVEKIENKIPDSRADLKALESALSAQKMMIHSGKMFYLPKLNAFGSYLMNDKQVFGFGSTAYLVGAQFSWSVFSGTMQHHKITEQKIERSRLEQQLTLRKEQAQLELEKTVRQLQDIQFALRQHEASVMHALEALRILNDRFEQGLATTNDLLQLQTTLAEQKLHQAEAFFKHQTTLAYIQFLTSTSEN
jgi:outer membrane protein TolC